MYYTPRSLFGALRCARGTAGLTGGAYSVAAVVGSSQRSTGVARRLLPASGPPRAPYRTQ